MDPKIEERSGRAVRAAAVALLLAGLTMAPVAMAGDAVVTRASGGVELGRGEPPVWQAAAGGDALAPGDRVRTARDGRAELSWQGATIRLYGDSLLRLPAQGLDGANGVELEDGSSLFDVHLDGGGSFEVHTKDVVVSVKGTRFGVAQAKDDPPEVWVYRGTVGVRALALATAREVMVREGFRAVGGDERPAEIFLLDQPDPWDHWIERPAPKTASLAPPARLAEDDAHRTARRTARDQALALAVSRNPKLAHRLATARAELQLALEREAKPATRSDGSEIVAAVDPLLDAATDDAERLLRSTFIERALNVPGNAIDVTLSSGGVIEIADSTMGQVWQLDESSLVAILDGSSTLPSGLDSALDATATDDQMAVATLLLGLLGR